ncbi:MAG: hypothetical protein ABJ004_18085 [Cyclobacteriaceae bacterium]
MQTINLPQVRLVQLQTLTEGVLQITEPLTEVAEQVQAAAAAFVDFQEGMTKSTSASNKKTLDRTRDVINSGFFKSVEAFLALRKGEIWVFGEKHLSQEKGLHWFNWGLNTHSTIGSK